MEQLTVTNEFNNQRLDKFLSSKNQKQSRAQLQKMIKRGAVLVNGEKTTVHHFLKKGDTITIKEPKTKPVQQMKKQAASQPAPMFKLEIVADTNDYLVINKQSGLLVHEAPGEHGRTVVDLVLEKYPNVRKIGEDPMRPGIVHRLDKDVSGLLVIAKTQDMFDHLKQQFKSRKTQKEYFALVYGAPLKPDGEITFNIDRSETQGHKMAAVPLSGNGGRGKKAVTQFEVIETIGNYTYLNVKPKTGRTHQIRVHLNAFGLPIVGDAVYRPRKLKVKIVLDRVFLHAHQLAFEDINGQFQEFNSPLPAQLQEILNTLKKGSTP